MILLLPYLDVFQNCFENAHTNDGRIAMRILYNPNNKILVSKKYITYLEQFFSNKDFFQALIKELYDSGRLESKNVNEDSVNIDDEFILLSNLQNIPVLLPLIFNDNINLEQGVPFICVKQKAVKLNKHWIQTEIAKNSQCIVSHLDFNNDAQIKKYFEDIFTTPRYIRFCYVFDRDKTHEKKQKLKGKNVKYYTLFTNSVKGFEKKQTLKYLRKELGGSLELWATSRKNYLHERKIIFENFILTCDNSFCNININEPTWEIVFYYSPDVASKWLQKNRNFYQVR